MGIAWEQRKLSDVYLNIGNAFVGTATPYYVENGHFYLESNNVKDGQINHNTKVFINDEFYEKIDNPDVLAWLQANKAKYSSIETFLKKFSRMQKKRAKAA